MCILVKLFAVHTVLHDMFIKPVPRKECATENYYPISQPKHMLWVLKRTVSTRRSFEHPKYMFKLIDKKIIAEKCFTGPMHTDYKYRNHMGLSEP